METSELELQEHGLNYFDIPIEELVILNGIIHEQTDGEESIISILENLLDNSNDEEKEKIECLLIELKNYD